MPSQRASRWSAIEHHPYFWQLLLTALFSKFVASGIVIHIKHLQLSRSTHALNHWHTACTGGCWNYQVLLPELSNMSYAIIMVVAYIIAFTIIEVSWQVEQLCDDIWRSRIQGAWLAKGIGLAWRLAIPGTLAVVLAQAVAITNSQREGDFFWLSVITAVFAHLIWPLQSLVMTTRDARIKRAATSVSLRLMCSALASHCLAHSADHSSASQMLSLSSGPVTSPLMTSALSVTSRSEKYLVQLFVPNVATSIARIGMSSMRLCVHVPQCLPCI